MSAILTGIGSFDEKFGGDLPGGSLTLIAGRYGVGKTSLYFQIAGTLANGEKRVLIFDVLESFVRERLSKQRLDAAKENELVEEADPERLFDVRAIEIRMKTAGRVDAVFIDSLQSLRGEKKSYKTYKTMYGEITRGLKQLAKKTDIPFFLTSKLPQTGGTYNRPKLRELRAYGPIEQNMDVVIFPYHAHPCPGGGIPDEAELILAKNRYGGTGAVPVRWNRERLIFEERNKEKNGKQQCFFDRKRRIEEVYRQKQERGDPQGGASDW